MPAGNRSRYYNLPVNRVTSPEGDTTEAIAVRPPPEPAGPSNTTNHLVTGLESIEYLAWRYFGQSDRWWRIADVNPNVFPLDQFPGAKLAIPASAEVGKTMRTRKL